MMEIRQRTCCPKCGRLNIVSLKKEHMMHCNKCGAEWHKSMTAHKEVKVYNNLPKGLREIAERKAAKKTAEESQKKDLIPVTLYAKT